MDKEIAKDCLKADIKYWENTTVSVDYLYVAISAIEKLELINQIVDKWNNDASHSFEDMCKINEILKQE